MGCKRISPQCKVALSVSSSVCFCSTVLQNRLIVEHQPNARAHLAARTSVSSRSITARVASLKSWRRINVLAENHTPNRTQCFMERSDLRREMRELIRMETPGQRLGVWGPQPKPGTAAT